MTKTVFDNGGYVGFKGTYGQTFLTLPSGLIINWDAANYPGSGTTLPEFR